MAVICEEPIYQWEPDEDETEPTSDDERDEVFVYETENFDHLFLRMDLVDLPNHWDFRDLNPTIIKHQWKWIARPN